MSSRFKNTEETARRPKGNKRQRRQQIIAAVIAIILAGAMVATLIPSFLM